MAASRSMAKRHEAFSAAARTRPLREKSLTRDYWRHRLSWAFFLLRSLLFVSGLLPWHGRTLHWTTLFCQSSRKSLVRHYCDTAGKVSCWLSAINSSANFIRVLLRQQDQHYLHISIGHLKHILGLVLLPLSILWPRKQFFPIPRM